MTLEDILKLEPNGSSKMTKDNIYLLDFMDFIIGRLEDGYLDYIDISIIRDNYNKLSNILDSLEFKTYGGISKEYICIIFKNNIPSLIFKYKGSDRQYIGLEDYMFLSKEFYDDLCYIEYFCKLHKNRMSEYNKIDDIVNGYKIIDNKLIKIGD